MARLDEAEAITVDLPPELVAALDGWIETAGASPRHTRPEAILAALTDFLLGLGYVQHREDSEGENGSR